MISLFNVYLTYCGLIEPKESVNLSSWCAHRTTVYNLH